MIRSASAVCHNKAEIRFVTASGARTMSTISSKAFRRPQFFRFITSNPGRITRAGVGLICLFVFTGCAAIQVRLGSRVYLETTPVASIAASLPKGPAIAPGEKSPLVVVVTQPDGKILQTEGKGGGKVLWKDLQVKTDVVAVNKKGVLSLDKDPRVTEGKVGHVVITAPSHPDVHAELDIPLRYDYAYKTNFNGTPGSSGLNGSDGLDGSSGMPGSTDPDHPSPGGNGSDGSNGSDGQDGGSGGDAPQVLIKIALRSANQGLLQVSVSASGRERFYLINPQGGSLTVSSSGGSGGSGGKGGRGGRGGSGGLGTPNGSSGRDGLSGRNGSDGSPGSDAQITVIYDPEAARYLGTIHLSNQGGTKPIYREEAVGPLW
jgi:hypothetical protein